MRVLEVQEKAGSCPTYPLAGAAAGRMARLLRLPRRVDAEEEGSLHQGDREMIVTPPVPPTSLYCVVAHGAILRIYEKKPLVADQVAGIPQGRHHAAPARHARFRMKVCLHSERDSTTPTSRRCTRRAFPTTTSGHRSDHGFLRPVHRMASFSNMLPTRSSHLMGRVAKQK